MRKLLALLIVVLSCRAANAVFAFKQCAVNTGCGGTATCATAAFASPLTNGSIILAGGVSTTAGSAFTATDTAANTYADNGSGVIGSGGAGTVGVLVSSNTHTTASNAVTVAQAAGTFFSVFACEYTGQAATTPVEGFCSRANGTTAGGSNNMTCTTAITPTGSDLIFVFAAPSTGPVSAGTGYTQRASAGGGESDQFPVSTAITPQATDGTTADNYNLIALAIKPASGVAIKPMSPAVY